MLTLYNLQIMFVPVQCCPNLCVVNFRQLGQQQPSPDHSICLIESFTKPPTVNYGDMNYYSWTSTVANKVVTVIGQTLRVPVLRTLLVHGTGTTTYWTLVQHIITSSFSRELCFKQQQNYVHTSLCMMSCICIIMHDVIMHMHHHLTLEQHRNLPTKSL